MYVVGTAQLAPLCIRISRTTSFHIIVSFWKILGIWYRTNHYSICTSDHMLLSSRRRAHTHDHSIASAVGALCGVHTLVALSSASENFGNSVSSVSELFLFPFPRWSGNKCVELLVLNNTAVEYHILQDRHFSHLSSSTGTPTTYNA